MVRFDWVVYESIQIYCIVMSFLSNYHIYNSNVIRYCVSPEKEKAKKKNENRDRTKKETMNDETMFPMLRTKMPTQPEKDPLNKIYDFP